MASIPGERARKSVKTGTSIGGGVDTKKIPQDQVIRGLQHSGGVFDLIWTYHSVGRPSGSRSLETKESALDNDNL